MNSLILLTSTPALFPGRWDIKLLTPAAAGDLIAAAKRGGLLVNCIKYHNTAELLTIVSGVKIHRYDPRPSSLRVETPPQIVEPKSGDVFMSVLLNQRGKRKAQGDALDSSDVDFYQITVL